MLDQELGPEVTVVDSHKKIVIGQTEDPMQGNGKSDQFRVGCRRVVPKNVTVDLIELPEPAFLRFFKSEKGRNAEPFDRLAIFARARRNQTSQGRGHLRSHTDVPISLVDETEQLRFQLLSTLSLVEFGRFQRGSVVLLKSK